MHIMQNVFFKMYFLRFKSIDVIQSSVAFVHEKQPKGVYESRSSQYGKQN